MNALLDGARRIAHRAAHRVRRRLSSGDDGFVLLESIIAITLITVIMGAIGVEFVGGMAAIARQRQTQNAAQVASSTLDQMRALRPTDLVAGRDSSTVATQFSKGNAVVSSIKPWLANMDPSVDTSATAGAGATATIPTCNPDPRSPTASTACAAQQPGTTPFYVSQFLGTCWLPVGGTDCVRSAQLSSLQLTTATLYLRAVVSVGWISGTCQSGCYYVTGTLISTAADPTFRANQAPTAAPIILSPGNQNNDIGDTVSVQLALQSGTGVPTNAWDIASGSLPAGLSLSSGGLISGIPTGPIGTTSVVVRVTDGYGRPATSTFTWTIGSPPVIVTPQNQVSGVNTAVSLATTISCQNAPCTYVLNNGPTGLAIDNTGVISGTPSVAGLSTTSITVTDAANRSVTSGTFTWSVLTAAAVCPTPVNLANGGFETPGVPPGAGSNIGNGTSGMVWRTSNTNNQIEYWANGASSTSNNGNTPISAKDGTQWVEANGGGLDTLYQDLATTPGQVLQWSLWHRARNATGNVNAQDSIQVQMGSTTQQVAQVPIGATSTTISDGAAAWVHYSGVYTVPTGQTTTRFQVAAVAVSSRDLTAGNFLDAVSVTGAPCLLTAVPPQSSTVNTAINPLQLTASQGSGGYTWSGGATLPTGLTLSPTGVITGTPTAVGSTSVSLVLTDSLSGYQQLVSFTWTVNGGPTVTTPANQTSSVGVSDTLQVNASCPNSPCTYTMTGAPPGLTINSSTGVVSGNPSTAGTFGSVTVTVTDPYGAAATTAAFTWTVYAAPTIATPSNSSIDVGAATTYPLANTCANTPCSFSATGLPPGLTIGSSTGVLSGSPTTPGVYNAVTATITDAAGATASTGRITVTIYARPTITAPGNQTDTVNTALILPISSTCSNASCTYALSGAPAGLTINASTGRITGTPSATGTSPSAKVTMTDAAGVVVDTGTFSWTITAAPSVTSPGNQSTANNAAVNVTLTKSCPDAPCAYRLNGGPAGLSITSAGVVTGTVTSAPRTFTGVTITVTDSSGATATSAGFTWTVTTPLAGRWKFDEASGSAVDASGNGHTAPLTGTYGRTSTTAQGAYALTLSGVSGSAATATGTVLNTSSSFTVSAWVKLNSLSNYQTFVSQDGSQVSAFFLQYRQDTGKFAFTRNASDSSSAAGTVASATAAPVVGQWYQLTGVYNSAANTLTLYVNGVRQGSPMSYSGGWNGTGSFVIGRGKYSGANSDPVNGAIDDVQAYSSALSDDAVAQLAQAQYLPLDDGTGTTAQDSSLNGNPGTLSGGTSWTTGIVGPSAVQFNGSNGVVTSTPNPLDTSQSFSVTAWAKADSTTSTGAVISADGGSISSFLLRQDNDKWLLASTTNDSGTPTAVTNVSSTSSLVVGQWYHLVGVYDSVAKTIALYVNGVLQGSPVSVSGSFKASGPLLIGRSYYQANTNFFSGAIDDVHAYRFALDQTGVTALVTLTPPSPATPTASAGSSSATVSWTAPTAVGGNPVTGYVVTPYLGGVAQTAVSYNSTATSQTVTGLTTGGSYTFTVAAKNASGTSAASPVAGSVLVS